MLHADLAVGHLFRHRRIEGREIDSEGCPEGGITSCMEPAKRHLIRKVRRRRDVKVGNRPGLETPVGRNPAIMTARCRQSVGRPFPSRAGHSGEDSTRTGRNESGG